MPERDFKGVWIPKEVWLDSRLTALDKAILAEIDSLDMSDRGCFASNRSLAEFSQCSERKVQDSVSRLKGYGYIRVDSFNGRERVLRSCYAFSAGQTRKNCVADTQNLRQSNTDIEPIEYSKEKDTPYGVSKKKGTVSLYESMSSQIDGRYGEELEAKVHKWFRYKAERRDKATATGIESLLSKIDRTAKKYGEQAVCTVIENSIAALYQGIVWDWIKSAPPAEQNTLGDRKRLG